MPSAADWNTASRTVPGHGIPGRGERRLERLHALEQLTVCAHEHLGRRGEPHAPPGLHEQGHPDLALELRQLLRHRRRASTTSAAATAAIVPRMVQFAQQGEAAQVDHGDTFDSIGISNDTLHETSLLLTRQASAD